jgi:hypothetical protein
MPSDLSFAGVSVFEIVLALIALELAGLAAYRWARGRGPALPDLLPNLAAGAALLLAGRAASEGASSTAVAAFLILAFGAHLADLRRRWPRR